MEFKADISKPLKAHLKAYLGCIAASGLVVACAIALHQANIVRFSQESVIGIIGGLMVLDKAAAMGRAAEKAAEEDLEAEEEWGAGLD